MSFGSFGGEAVGMAFRLPRWVRVFEGEYRDAKHVVSALEERSIPTELTFPKTMSTSTTVLVRVHGGFADEARELVRSMGFNPPSLSWEERRS
jgi:hypothetical protein